MAEVCGKCHGSGLIEVPRCTCGASAATGIPGSPHERMCGTEPCPNGCYARLHPVPDHEACPGQLIDGMAPVEVVVSTEPPLVAGPWTTEPFICPHGTAYWLEPTGEQVAQWTADGTP